MNDLDEAWPASYALDLVRLSTSAYLAISGEHLGLTRREAAEAIEEGYRDALAAGGKAFVLAEHHQWLRLLALGKLRDPVRFWDPVDRETAARSHKINRGLVPTAAKSLPIEAPYRWAREFGTSSDFGPVVVTRRIYCPGSQGNPHFCVGLVPRNFIRRGLRRKIG